MIADFSSALGSIWFAGLTFLAGYLLGHLFPIGKMISKIGGDR